MHCLAMKLQLDLARIDVMQMPVASNIPKSRGKHRKTEIKMKIDLHLLDLSRKRENDSRSPNGPGHPELGSAAGWACGNFKLTVGNTQRTNEWENHVLRLICWERLS